MEEEIVRRQEQAKAYHHKGYNCAQSTALALVDLAPCDFETLYALLEGFGLGMGDKSQTCGAVSGVVALVGLANSDGSEKHTSKHDTYARVSALHQEFCQLEGSTKCMDLRPADRERVTEVCDGYIARMVEIGYRALV